MGAPDPDLMAVLDRRRDRIEDDSTAIVVRGAAVQVGTWEVGVVVSRRADGQYAVDRYDRGGPWPELVLPTAADVELFLAERHPGPGRVTPVRHPDAWRFDLTERPDGTVEVRERDSGRLRATAAGWSAARAVSEFAGRTPAELDAEAATSAGWRRPVAEPLGEEARALVARLHDWIRDGGDGTDPVIDPDRGELYLDGGRRPDRQRITRVRGVWHWWGANPRGATPPVLMTPSVEVLERALLLRFGPGVRAGVAGPGWADVGALFRSAGGAGPRDELVRSGEVVARGTLVGRELQHVLGFTPHAVRTSFLAPDGRPLSAQ
ncbi:hypothetical protein [Blastococcus sp. TF02A-26]|uniref:hypothetical protein n=1 Tax=Blastococcus sp. TF02A-26 TaxID=2250577 RepID=UPI000DEBA47D|nr:hypothetical protein [Blastococcus sp. TF02A-26]RBY85093.1 hypothetical protein DQ240_12725 [Blastococcus sp. TF02A-26]